MIPVGPDGGSQSVHMITKDMEGKIKDKILFGVVC